MLTLRRGKKPSDVHYHIHQKRVAAQKGFSVEEPTGTTLLHGEDGKSNVTLRRDIILLWKSTEAADMEYLDRLLLAMHKYQTDGQLYYRRICGMHGGGGGTKDEGFAKLLEVKAVKDSEKSNGHYPPGQYSGEVPWPNPMPNVKVENYELKQTPFVYTFCWHGKVPFIVWHRPLMREFERGLQMHDPNFDESDETDERFFGDDALGAPYWAWEEWGGNRLPKVIENEEYVFKTNKYEKLGYPQGTKIPNPYYRWLAPVPVPEQVEEKFDHPITDTNCTTRDPAYTDPHLKFQNPWNQSMRHPESNPAMGIVCRAAMTEVDFQRFASVEQGYGSALWSIEHPHNNFHNHLGEVMPTLQSSFDPIFWLHHSNVERQFFSWQQYHFVPVPPDKVKNGVTLEPKDPKSVPIPIFAETVLYPWTKPELLKENKYSWNTESAPDKDGSLKDWFYADLTYRYEGLLKPLKVTRNHGNAFRVEAAVTVSERDLNGNFTLYYDNNEIAQTSRLNGFGKGCGRCETKDPVLTFDISWLFWNESKTTIKQVQNALKKNLTVERTSDNTPLNIVAVNFDTYPTS